MEPLVLCKALTKLREHSFAIDYRVCFSKGGDYSNSLVWKSFKVLTKLFWTAGCPLTRRVIIDLVTTKPEFCSDGIQGKTIIELVAAMNDEVSPDDEVDYYRSIFAAAMDAEELIHARKDELLKLDEQTVSEFMVNVLANMLQPFTSENPSRELRKELEADCLRVRGVLCSRVLDSENGYPAEVREAALNGLRGLDNMGFRPCEPSLLWEYMQSQQEHVFYRLLEILHWAAEADTGGLGGLKNLVRDFLWGVWLSCSPFDKRCALLYTSCWWHNSSSYDIGTLEVMREFEEMVLKDWKDSSQQAYMKTVNDAVARGNVSLLNFHYQAEETLARQLFAFHQDVSPVEDSIKNVQRTELFMTNLLVTANYEIQKNGELVTLLGELLKGPYGEEYLSTLHTMWFGFYAQELYSGKSKLHGRKLMAFVDKFRDWGIVFEWLMKQAEQWQEIQHAALMFGKMIQLLTSAGNPKHGSEQRRMWGQFSDTISWLMVLASELLGKLPNLTESQQGDPGLSLAFNLLAARLQVLGEQIAKFSPSAFLTERFSCIQHAMDSVLGCDILPARFLPRLIEPQVKEDQRLEHLRMLKALVRDQTGDIYCRGDGGGPNKGDDDPAKAASKAAAKALKKKRQKEKREQSVQEAKEAQASLQTAAASLHLRDQST